MMSGELLFFMLGVILGWLLRYSQKKERKNRMTGYCKWCDTLTDDIVQDFNSETGMLVWTGCLSCKIKRIEEVKQNER